MSSENKIAVDDELIVRYLAGEATPEEAMALDDWLEEAVNKFHFEELAMTWNAMYPAKRITPQRKENAWAQLNNTIAQSKKPRQPRLSVFSQLGIKIAAALVLIIISGFVIYALLGNSSTEKILTYDNQKQIVLSDRSKVTLYHNTAVTFPREFDDNSREVEFTKGEAFFSVAHDEQKPFIVHTPFADVKVLGTEFNVVANEDQVEVEVKEGMVLLSTSNDNVYLKAGSSGIVKFDNGPITIRNEVNVNEWAYATRRFEFAGTPMEDVIRDVEKAFPCTISVSNENIKKCKLTATFDNDSVEKIVYLITETLNLSLKQNGRTFTLEGEGCP